MIKLNRIGNKLGLAGAFGILLAGGMVANQMMTEASVGRATDVADRSQRVAESALSAHSNLRQIEIQARNIRMARTQDEVEKNAAGMRRFAAAAANDIDTAFATAMTPESKERLQKIKSLTSSFMSGVEDFAKTQGNLLAQIDKRSAISMEWTKAVEAELGSPALAKLDNRAEIEKALHQADAKVNMLRAAVWRLGATGDTSLIAAMTQTQSALKKIFNQLRGEADDRSLLDVVSSLDSIVKRFLAINDEVVKMEQLKADIGARALKSASEATELMETAVSTAQENNKAAKEQVSAQVAWANRLNVGMAIVVMGSLIGAMVFSFLGVARPMTRLNGALGEMAGGNLNVVIPGASRGDEIGDLAKTVTVIRENSEQKARDEVKAKLKQDEILAGQRRVEMVRLADQFEGAVSEIVETVSSASTELEASASTLTATAERSQELTTMVAAASEEAATNVQSVASSTEEMASSITEISRQVQESARMAGEAVEQARTTNSRVGELSKAAARIGDVVELINTIAGQTNLLALNATIEAARAGEAGRGFAVVASEVKSLATQTAKATEEISGRINAVVGATGQAVTAIDDVGKTIARVNEIALTIAAAVEEQSATTSEISRAIGETTRQTESMATSLERLLDAASDTNTSSQTVVSSASGLSDQAASLKSEVAEFVARMKAA